MKNFALTKYLIAAAIGLLPLASNAALYGFDGITNNNPTDVLVGESQLQVEVTASGPDVLFRFTNTGLELSSITDVYFDDGSLLGIASISGGLGVSFSQDASPPNLPGGNNADPDFEVTQGFLADSDSPVQPNGVNPGEFLDILFSLQGGQTFADVLDELLSGALRIGIHVQGFASGGSESFVNTGCVSDCGGGPPPQEIPEPASLLLVGLGLIGAGLMRRRRIG